jgi:hypothetical protein
MTTAKNKDLKKLKKDPNKDENKNKYNYVDLNVPETMIDIS